MLRFGSKVSGLEHAYVYVHMYKIHNKVFALKYRGTYIEARKERKGWFLLPYISVPLLSNKN